MKLRTPAIALIVALALTGCVPDPNAALTDSARQAVASLDGLTGDDRVAAIMAYASAYETDALLISGVDAAAARQLRAPLTELIDSEPQVTFTPATYREGEPGGVETFLGLGFVMIGWMGENAMNSADQGELGAQTGATPGGTAEITVGKDSVSSTFESTVTEGTSSAAVKSETQLDYCPDPNGELELTGNTDVNITVNGANVQMSLDVVATVHLDYTATIAASDYTYRSEFASSANGKGQFFDHSSGAHTDITVNRMSSAATMEFAQSAVDSAATLANMVAEDMVDAAKRGWESGRCVDLRVTPSADRSSLETGESITIEADPVAVSDGKQTGGIVVATLSGEGSLDPDGTETNTPATLDYTAGDSLGDAATITFESRSNRGVGKATLPLQVGGQAYSAIGTEGEFTASGTICSLTSQFVLTGNGLTLTFTPADELGGTYRLTGAVDGVTFIGDGTYTVTQDEDYMATNVIVIGEMTLTTPEGVTGTSPANIDVVLTPIEPCE